MISVESVGIDDPRVGALWHDFATELEELYGESELSPPVAAEGVVANLIALAGGGEPVGTVVVRWSRHHPDRPGTVEVNRLYVRPQHRGHGYARVMMGAVERAALRVGATRLVLGTGRAQPGAIALYAGIGYTTIPAYGPYLNHATTVCMAKSLPTRVLVVNGARAAGTTTTGVAIHDVLGDAGAHVAFIDADALCQVRPAPHDDPDQQQLLWLNLAALAPLYRTRGYGCVVVARRVTKAEDRERYARVFAGPVGPAQVSVVRVTATDQTRVARITAGQPAGGEPDADVAASLEVAEVLDSLDLDDGVVATDVAPADEVARQVLDAAGWWVPGAGNLTQ